MPTAIDLFSGAGGFTEGAEQAGLKVLWAGNHWAEAVQIHAANHPQTVHTCQDLHQVDWTTVPPHDVLLASPACQGHSRARGKDKPYHDALRSTAWAVTTALEIHRPSGFLVENVPEFMDWELFDVWWASLQKLGYKLTVSTYNAADFGVPQNRVRLFIMGGKKWPISVFSPNLPHVPARDIIDWDHGSWSLVRAPGRAERTLAQYQNGRRIYGDEFLIAYFGHERNGRSVDKPFGTMTTKDKYAVVRGDQMRMLTVDEVRCAMGFPAHYQLPPRHKDAIKMLGNAVPPPLARGILQQLVHQLA